MLLHMFLTQALHHLLLLTAASVCFPILLVDAAAAPTPCRTDCGAGIRVGYPFGIDGGCGSPQFKGIFVCATEGILNMSTPSGPYQVNSIDYTNRTLVLSIQSQPLSACYSYLSSTNFSLPVNGPFSVINTTFLLMNCPLNSSILASPQHFCNFTTGLCEDWVACAPGYSGPLLNFRTCCVHLSNTIEIIDPTYLECPSLQFTSMYNLNTSSSDAFYWNYGIQLQWQDPQESTLCNDCEGSKGICGYNYENSFVCICAQGNTTSNCNSFALSPTSTLTIDSVKGAASQKLIALILGVTVPVVTCGMLSSYLLLWWYRRFKNSAPYEEDDAVNTVPVTDEIVQRFSYRQLVTATSNFKFELGRGGYGIVYKGILPSGQEIAVKVLEGSRQGEQTFQSEVATLGSLNHVNLVKLFGYCSEGESRLLVYEYMSNSSLSKHIFRGDDNKTGTVLDWEKRYAVALGAARGIEYLHEGCRQHIVHCDIKPENILLDAGFRAKVGDFGLAKLMDRLEEESHFENSRVRGTCGYIAPEWLQGRGKITKKSDVYSFGMMLLEIVSGRRNVDPEFSSGRVYFPDWALQKLQQGSDGLLLELMDETALKGGADEEQVRLLVQVALWCIQENPSYRPSMNHVVKMLDGKLPIPPIPSLPS